MQAIDALIASRVCEVIVRKLIVQKVDQNSVVLSIYQQLQLVDRVFDQDTSDHSELGSYKRVLQL